MNDESLDRKVLEWFANGETGISSEAMACAVVGIDADRRWAGYGNHPSDPADLRRCMKFLEFVPEAKDRLDKVAELSDVWWKLIDNWDLLEGMLNEELPTGRAKKTYEKMKEFGC